MAKARTQAATKKASAKAAATKKAPAMKATKTTKTPAKKAVAKTKNALTTSSKARASKSTANATAASKKRKADDDEDERPVKKVRAAKPEKLKVVINHAPTQKLNVYVFGEGSAGELGLGHAKNVIDVKRPRLNPLLSAQNAGVIQIACGGMHVAALTHDNKILTWGVNDQGALGRDTTWSGGLKDVDQASEDSDDEDSGLNPFESTPTAISSDSFPAGTVFTSVSAGDSTTFAVTDEGKVYGWGTFRVSLVCFYIICLTLLIYDLEQYWHSRLHRESKHCAHPHPHRQPQKYHKNHLRREPRSSSGQQGPDICLG